MTLFANFPKFLEIRLHPLRHARHNNGAIRQQNDKEHILDWSLDRVRKANEPERNRRRSKFLSFQRADLYVVESGHEVSGDLCRFLFGLWHWENSVHQPQKHIQVFHRPWQRLCIGIVRLRTLESPA
jgi:hypothetical protein